MPVDVFTFRDDSGTALYCVREVNPDGTPGERVQGGCHENEQDAIQHKTAINIAHAMRDGFGAKQVGALRHMLLVTSNAYRDKEGEIIKQAAWEKFVDSQWINNEFVGANPLLAWHGGDPLGEIVWADMEGPFLVEVARELPDREIELKRDDVEAPIPTTIKAVWDGLESDPDVGASHYFVYDRADVQNGDTYGTIYKVETSVLEGDSAANPITIGIVI